MRKTIFLLLSISVLLDNRPAAAQAKVSGKLSNAINNIGQKFVHTPGHSSLSIGVIKNGITYSYNFARENDVHPTNKTIYEIASITKSFTGILVAHAILENKISLDDDVRKYLPYGFSNLNYKGVPIKIRHLVTHTSGLPKFIPDLGKGLSPAEIMERYGQFSREQFLNDLSKAKIETKPGSEFIYSNADAQLIGIILEKVYHQTYGSLLKRYITEPRQLASTGLEVNGVDTARFTKGHNQNGEVMPRLLWWKNTPAAGHIKSDIYDMLKYLKLNLNERDPAIALAHRPIFKITEEGADSIGIFWFVKRSAQNQRCVFHAGGSFGTTSYCEIHPDTNSGIVILANDASPGTEEEFKRIATVVLGMDN